MPVSAIRYRRPIAYILDLLQETVACFRDSFTLTISALSTESIEAEGEHKRIFHLVNNAFKYEIFDI